MNFFFIFYLFLMSLLSLVLVRKHVLLCLLSLEFIILSLLYLILLYCLLFSYSIYIYLFFMVLYVCEGVLGLSVLVCLIRSHGNDYLNSMFLW
uniref:NADH dehydrogenase subunit 4l n=1 Tax=Anidiocerus bimaculatus TaxID=3108262 RepID=UPI002E79C938|nr:NADH dehydrogenase subunit 4l [Anidiocerus bimaculatus]WQF69864.1 NADH dehydrogenase subunit 4l [Anidiocerus bimaculatus]